jgi:hypothetical protein
MVLTDPVTPARINFSEIKTNTPAAKAHAIGNPTSPTSAKKSINSLPIISIFNLTEHFLKF